MLFRITAAAIFASSAAAAQGIDIRLAELTFGYKSGETASALQLDGTRIGLGVDIGLADNFGIDAEIAYTTDAAPFEFDGYEILLNPYWNVSQQLRLGVFWDMTNQNFGAGERSSEIYGVTAVYEASDQLVVDGYAGTGEEDLLALGTNVAGLAANYALGNGWALGGSVDYQEIDTGGGSLDVTRLGVATSYTFGGIGSGGPLTMTFNYDRESQAGFATSPGIFGLSLSIPLGGSQKPARPAKNRRGIHVDRPLT